jgi:hypothetical protein
VPLHVDAASYPVSFRWADATPILSPGFDRWRDSIASVLEPGQILRLTGLWFRDETPQQGDELALLRATAISELFNGTLPGDRIALASDVGRLSADIKRREFPAYKMEVVFWNDFIRESKDFTLIKFPFDSTDKAWDKSIYAYTFYLKDRLRHNDECVDVYPFGGVNGRQEVSEVLMKWRLEALRKTLINSGLAPFRVRVSQFPFPGRLREPLEDENQNWFVVVCNK